MRIVGKFVDDDGEREFDEVLPPNNESEKVIENIWVKSFKDMLMNALKCGDDVEILVKRKGNKKNIYTT